MRPSQADNQKGVKPAHLTKSSGIPRGPVVGLLVSLCVLLALPPVSGTEPIQPVDKPGGESREAPESQVWVTYYYTSYRCPTCKKLEAYSRKAIEEGFPAELEEKRIVFRTLNLDEPENSRCAEDYKLVTKSLIVSLNRNGKEIKWKNLPDIWKLVGDQEKFGEYVQRETRSFLEEL
jgi:hypothetical protein